jgi:hypothetical protein
MPISKKIAAIVKSTIFGAAVGAIALASVGFTWGGWVTGGSAEKAAERKANAAVILALAPICVDNFRRQPNAGALLVNFQRLASFDQTGFVEKGKWAAMLGSEDDNSAVTQACGESLAKLTAADLR